MSKQLVLIASFCLLASTSKAAEFYPAAHPMCLDQRSSDKTKCSEGREFYFDESGRCGCLSPKDFYDMDSRIRIRITCDEGQRYEVIYENYNMCGMIIKRSVSCGCFSNVKSEMTTTVR